jgi:hypothetical protein
MVQIHGHRVGDHDVRPGLTRDADLSRARQNRAQPRQVRRQRVPRTLRQAVAPHPLQKLLGRHRPVDIHQHRREHAPLTRVADVDGPIIETGLDLPQQPERHPHGRPPPVVRGGFPSYRTQLSLS